MLNRPTGEQIILHPLEVFAAEYKPTPPNPRQQEVLMKGALNISAGGPFSDEDKGWFKRNAADFIPRMVTFIQEIKIPYAYEDLQPKVEALMEPISGAFFGANGIQEGDFYGYYDRFPSPVAFENAWQRYASRLNANLEPETMQMAHDRVGYILYGKQWEYWAQAKHILGSENPTKPQINTHEAIKPIRTPTPMRAMPAAIESLVERGLLFSDTGTLLIPHSEHATHCDDSVAIGPYAFAIADGVGSGGEKSGDIARFMTKQLENVKQQPTSKDEAEQILSTMLHNTADEIRRVQGPEDLNKSLMTSQINTVGVIGILSTEYGKTYANLATVGNCRAYIINKDGQIKLVTKDRTFVADHNRRYPQDPLDEKNHTLASAVTTTAAEPKEADYYRTALEEGDVLVAMSDGVSGPFSREALEKYLCETMIPDISKGVQSEYRVQDWATALGNGATRETPHDDISVIVAKLG